MGFFQKIEAVWQNVSVVQRALLIAIVLTFIVVGGLLTRWVRMPDMGLLYSGLDAEEAAKIVEKIGEKGIVYKLASGGTTIYVPKENISQLRLDMAKEGLPEGGQKGYGIFDNEKIGISPFVQNVNLNRALQDELAKSIQMIDGVVHARVHIVSPEHTLFTSTTPQTSASVVLRLKAGYRLSGLNIAAITHLVASGVEGLKSENITIVDSQGRLLSSESDQAMGGGAGTVADYRERVEQSLADKVENMLTAVLGPGRATIKVSAEIDMNSSNLVTKSYDATGVVVKEEIKEKSKTPGSNVGADGKPIASGGKETDNTITTNKLFGEKVETVVDLPGKITSLAVAAFVDLYPADPNAKDLIITEASVVDIIKNALGLKDATSIKVVNARFSRPTESLLGAEETKKFDFVAIAGQASLGIMAVCALLVLKMFSGAKKKATLMSAAAQLPADEITGGFLPAGTEGADSLVLRRQIANSLRNNPEQAKQLFSSWIEKKGS
ncbi:MAG: flagellar basal-body MS-ring/collar protein FliF [Phycisphaerae bacterium]|nr:flagellar basal-body MS-ring/collar protein FliF [Phycisphaerae bacterium]